MATSRLVVVRAVTAALRRSASSPGASLSPTFVELPWGDALIDSVADGSLAMCIYNESRGLERIGAVGSVTHAGTLGYSMGGRNFAVVASRHGRWAGCEMRDLSERFADASVIVGRSTDRFSNLLDVLGLPDEASLRDRNITVIDVADSPCTMLLSMPDAIMVAGQNRRIEARQSPDLVELDGFDDLGRETRSRIRSRSANALFVADRLPSELGMTPEQIRLVLWSQVSLQWASEADTLLHVIADESEFDGLSMAARLEAAEEIVFATYRFGTPR